mmetsp:Transcript_4177/g.12559  ORF Transcript_4177/g.12559 Transcript_4177/m.12559 type:complete len:290 (+) Transcript_4177:1122-1991(+)
MCMSPTCSLPSILSGSFSKTSYTAISLAIVTYRKCGSAVVVTETGTDPLPTRKLQTHFPERTSQVRTRESPVEMMYRPSAVKLKPAMRPSPWALGPRVLRIRFRDGLGARCSPTTDPASSKSTFVPSNLYTQADSPALLMSHKQRVPSSAPEAIMYSSAGEKVATEAGLSWASSLCVKAPESKSRRQTALPKSSEQVATLLCVVAQEDMLMDETLPTWYELMLANAFVSQICRLLLLFARDFPTRNSPVSSGYHSTRLTPRTRVADLESLSERAVLPSSKRSKIQSFPR